MSERKPRAIEARSVVSSRNLEAYIQIVLLYDDGSEEPVTQWTPEEAWHHILAVSQAVEAASTDAFLVAFMTKQIGVDFEKAMVVLRQFREWRDRMRPPERPM